MRNFEFINKISQILFKNPIIFILILAIIFNFVFAEPTSFAFAEKDNFANSLPQTIDKKLKVIKTYSVPVTAYNSEPGQTDSTPCITANGFNLCQNNEENVIAANFLPFGTMVKFPQYSGDTIYTVQDRMNKRYAYRADIWMKSKANAYQFGKRYLSMEVYRYE